MGRVIHSVRSATDQPGKKYAKTGMIVYDPAGRVIRKSQISWAGDDEIDAFKAGSKEKYPTTTEYDAAGRVARVTLPEGFKGEAETSISYTYNDPWETIETHSVGRSKRTVKNARGQVLFVEDSGTGDDGRSVEAKIGFAYDIAGNRVKKMDLLLGSGLNPTLTETADTGNSVSKKFELGYCYAHNGNLTGKTVYDPDIGNVDDAWNYSYSNHAATQINTARAGLRFQMRYDAAGNMVDHGKNLAKEMAYDSYNRIRTVTDPANGNVKGQYWYDDQGFRVRRVAREQVDGRDIDVEVLYPSMYFGVEVQRDLSGNVIQNAGFGVNNIYLNGSGQDDRLQTQDRMS